MKYIIYIFYGAIFLSGGMRNYFDEMILHETSLGLIQNTLINELIFYGEYFSLLLTFLILIFPFNKWLHLLYGIIVFCIEFYIENFVFFEKYIILIDFIPFLFFFLIHYKDEPLKLKNIQNITVKIIAIGYVTACISKMTVGWLDYKAPVAYSYIVSMNELKANIPFHSYLFFFNEKYLQINNLFFHKLANYFVLVFQGSALFIFFKPQYFKKYAVFTTLFHILILLFLGIGCFYPYILVYTVCVMNLNLKTFRSKRNNVEWIFLILGIVWYMSYFVYWNCEIGFLNNYTFFLLFFNVFLTLLCSVLYFIKLNSHEKRNIWNLRKNINKEIIRW